VLGCSCCCLVLRYEKPCFPYDKVPFGVIAFNSGHQIRPEKEKLGDLAKVYTHIIIPFVKVTIKSSGSKTYVESEGTCRNRYTNVSYQMSKMCHTTDTTCLPTHAVAIDHGDRILVAVSGLQIRIY
jgi:hypothetical protein